MVPVATPMIGAASRTSGWIVAVQCRVRATVVTARTPRTAPRMPARLPVRHPRFVNVKRLDRFC